MPEFVIPDADPMDELRRWLAEAAEAGISNPAAMVLATVSPDGRPSARAVMVGTRDPGPLTFFSHYESPKGRDMDDNPAVEGVFLWTPLERQVRVSGTGGEGDRRRVGRLLVIPSQDGPAGHRGDNAKPGNRGLSVIGQAEG